MWKLNDVTAKATHESKENQISQFHSCIESVLLQWLLAAYLRLDITGFQLFRKRKDSDHKERLHLIKVIWK